MNHVWYKWIAVLMVTVMAVSTLTGCDIVKHANAVQPINGADTIKDYEEATQAGELEDTYNKGLNNFSYKLFSKLRDGENVFISPYSISMALSMLYNGADKETREEMAQMLGYSLLEGYTKDYNAVANNTMNANSRFLIEALKNADPKVQFNVANSIWLSTNGEFSDAAESALLAPARFYYDADIFNVDFKEDKTLDSINQWVSKKTEGMIDPFIESFSDKEMLRLFLVNAIYFNGKWSIPFSPDVTRKDLFYGETATKEVDMMYLSGEKFRYYSENGIRGLELPYGEGRIVMDILLPEDTTNGTIHEAYNELTTEQITQLMVKLDKVEKLEVNTLALPKFELEYGMVNLNETLQELGMKKAFQAGAADFGPIGGDLYVSLVGHTAKIKVEEWGTEASAATGIDVNTTAMPVGEPLNFIVDVPFVFLIRDTETNTILFLGEMNQPE